MSATLWGPYLLSLLTCMMFFGLLLTCVLMGPIDQLLFWLAFVHCFSQTIAKLMESISCYEWISLTYVLGDFVDLLVH